MNKPYRWMMEKRHRVILKIHISYKESSFCAKTEQMDRHLVYIFNMFHHFSRQGLNLYYKIADPV